MSISKGRLAGRTDRYGLRRRGDGDDGPPERPPSLSEHVCLVIREDILTGRQPAGARLTEAMVMERTGVSRTPVREGLRTLEGEGLVITYRSRGTFVTYRLTPAEALLLYEVRLVLEPHLARLGAERMTPELLASVENVLARFVDALDAAEAREAGQLDADFHLTIYEASGSELSFAMHVDRVTQFIRTITPAVSSVFQGRTRPGRPSSCHQPLMMAFTTQPRWQRCYDQRN